MKKIFASISAILLTVASYAQSAQKIPTDTLDILTSAIWEMVPPEGAVMAPDIYLVIGPEAHTQYLDYMPDKGKDLYFTYQHYLSDRQDLLFDPSNVAKNKNGRYIIYTKEGMGAIPGIYEIVELSADKFVYKQSGDGMEIEWKRACTTDELLERLAKMNIR